MINLGYQQKNKQTLYRDYIFVSKNCQRDFRFEVGQFLKATRIYIKTIVYDICIKLSEYF